MIGIFVGGRTPVPKGFMSFCDQLAKRMEAGINWIPWLEGPYLPRWKTYWSASRGRYDEQKYLSTLGDLLCGLQEYAIILTDTYHLAVNAWRLGTPALCIGEPQPSRHRQGHLTLGDLKKQVFYDTYDAADFYLTAEDFRSSGRKERAAELASLLLEECGGRVAERIHAHARSVEARLLAELNAGLQKP